MTEVANFLFVSGKKFFDSFLSDWGIIGFGMIAVFVVPRIVNFMKRFFR